MTTTAAEASAVLAAGSPVTPGELVELLAAFNEVTGKLEATHESLRREVVRLQAELRDANEQLHRSKRLAALGEMAAGIAHEVRNPLGSIRLYARMLEQDLADRPSERQVAGKIIGAVQGLDAVVGDVLIFSREIRVHAEAGEPSELFDKALSACWDEATKSGEIRVMQQESLRGGGIRNAHRTRLWCDPVLMRQALVNIIRNAVDAMRESQAPEEGHTLTLEAGPTRDADGRGRFAIAVSDTGPGVDEGVIDRMFNPFFTTRKSGTGLGLAIVHRIVDAHGGRVQVSNNARSGGRGTTFRILLPPAPGGDAGVDETQTQRVEPKDRPAPQGRVRRAGGSG